MQMVRNVLTVAFIFTMISTSWGSEPKTHDGFHFQLTAGLGRYSSSGEAPANQDFTGLTYPMSLLLGGTLFGHLAFGGGMYFDYASDPNYELNGQEIKGQITSQTILGLGLYGDYYIDPEKNGLHIQAFFGFGGLETSFNGNTGGSDPVGTVWATGVGYEWWISDQWSGGVMGRFLYGPFNLNDTAFPTNEFAIVGTLTWH